MDLHTLLAVGSGAIALISSYVTLMVRLEVANHRARQAEAKSEERAELLKWINGSFMRASVVEVRLGEMERRLENMEREARS